MRAFDPYEELGLPRDASPADIKNGYRQRAKTAHPDAGGSPDAFHRARTAMVVLSDPKRRKKFDDTGTFEEPEPDNQRSGALQIIEGMLGRAVNDFLAGKGPDPRQCDLIAEMCGKLNAEISEIDVKYQQGEKVVQFMRDMEKRFSGGTDKAKPLERSFQNRAAHIEAERRAMREAIELRRIALIIIGKYQFRYDQPSEWVYVTVTSAT